MYLTKAFVISLAMVLVFLLAAFATEQSRCVDRARRILQEEFSPVVPVSADYISSESPAAPPVCETRRRGGVGLG